MGVAVAALVVLVAACGSDPAAEPGGTATPPEGSTSAFPLSIEHRFGTTEIAAPPERVVAIDGQWIDVLIALDHPPVAHPADHMAGGEEYPWRGSALAGSTVLDATDGIPYEAIRKAGPDLILATWAIEDQSSYDLLKGSAPTIASVSDREVETWEDLVTLAGRLLGRENDAAALIDDTHGQVADVAAEHPDLNGKTFVMANYVAGDAIYVVADPEDGASQLFAQLGMSISPTIAEHPDASDGRVKLSTELISQLDGDVLLILTNGTDLDDIPGLAALPAAESGAVYELDWIDATALNTPSPLSIPYVLDRILPTLEAAAG